jgi:hypothetical protein
MTPTEQASCWAPVPLRWRHAIESDVFVAPDGSLWQIIRSEIDRGSISITASCGPDQFSRSVDPDDVIPVLVPVPEREAVELTIEELGARLVERRTQEAIE